MMDAVASIVQLTTEVFFDHSFNKYQFKLIWWCQFLFDTRSYLLPTNVLFYDSMV